MQSKWDKVNKEQVYRCGVHGSLVGRAKSWSKVDKFMLEHQWCDLLAKYPTQESLQIAQQQRLDQYLLRFLAAGFTVVSTLREPYGKDAWLGVWPYPVEKIKFWLLAPDKYVYSMVVLVSASQGIKIGRPGIGQYIPKI